MVTAEQEMQRKGFRQLSLPTVWDSWLFNKNYLSFKLKKFAFPITYIAYVT